MKKKETTPQILPPTRQKIFDQKVNKTKIPTKFDSEFVAQLKEINFRGLWIFNSYQTYERWMFNHANKLIYEYKGTYNAPTKKWFFPWGATLDLQILVVDEDFAKLRGMNFTWVEVTGEINPEIQQKALEIIASGFRNKR